ncbi:hypothetical protein COV81_01695 [Candidatus Peregrinibacteria bacterium CG11_big_fil_rev_8_21_14_0_20_41_10]|nr:MAG: hypothetical protein COV81_01695 [Candidatus Peregrinibacteria bacterium CG11_big_fil_rev_8_21_14_0_20_41_10]PIZ76870.1 MAG: hypothetical protein COY06_01215 [Candidatus Peregrinibacteria bacterium CG_4_10_14_0_2_um_filter_41_8]PJC37584.1 MAG: hypothetical protein CO045_04695 [Candidatus Peregrinibacteria bacterium CG_4_9_14_0_2_um_filter_41_14]
MQPNNLLVKVSRQPELTVAELSATLNDIEYIKLTSDYLQIQTDQQLDQAFINRLGSTPKIYKIITELTEADLDSLETHIASQIGSFALNWETNKNFEQQFKKDTLSRLKKALKLTATSKVRYLNKGVTNVKDAYLLDQGFTHHKVTEFTILSWEDNYLLLQAVAIQDINSYSFRDFEKPTRDMNRGMFPPKLAQILINIATSNIEKPVIYDPFCGIGTVAIEASLQQIPSFNSDISGQAIIDTHTNMAWINQKFANSSTNWKAIEADATRLENVDLPWDEITSIVTEGFLGPIINKSKSKHSPHDHFRQLEKLYLEFLESLATKIKKGTKVVFCLPVHHTTETNLHFCKKIVENLQNLGYSKLAFFPDTVKEVLGLKLTERDTMVYIRSNQYVGREIVLAQKY